MEKDTDNAQELIERRERLLAQLPPLEEIVRGSLFERSVRCGKPSCRCADGPGHPVTYLSVSFAGGRTEQITVPKHLVPYVRRWVDNYSRWWDAIERISAINRRLLRLRLLPTDTPTAAPRKGRRSQQ